MSKFWLIFLCVAHCAATARNPFVYEKKYPEKPVQVQPKTVAQGAYGTEKEFTVIENGDGTVKIIVEKIPSTLGKAEGLGG